MSGNIRRIVCFLLVLCLTLSLSSCVGEEEAIVETDAVSSESVAVSESTEVLYGYEKIECKTTEGATARYFSFDDDPTAVISLTFPMEWAFTKSDDGYDILRDGEKIGSLTSGKTDLKDGETSCGNGTDVNKGVRASWDIISSHGEFIHRVVYSCTIDGVECAMTLEVGYAELDEFGLRKVKYSTDIKETRTDARLGTIDLSARAGEKPILIVGNSFIGSSQVGSIFEQMCDASGKNDYEVIWVSQGMATVSKNWSEYKDGMRNGSYAAVFMCGFYGMGDVTAFKTFVDLCSESNTPIVIFPAHNEGNGDTAAKTYPDVHYLDWKGELDAFIDSGVSRWDLCVDDTYDHSKPLAGYVGAHMIYRALFGEIPPVLDVYYNVQHDTVVELLGDYARTGYIDLSEDMIIYSMQ